MTIQSVETLLTLLDDDVSAAHTRFASLWQSDRRTHVWAIAGSMSTQALQPDVDAHDDLQSVNVVCATMQVRVGSQERYRLHACPMPVVVIVNALQPAVFAHDAAHEVPAPVCAIRSGA